MKNMTVQNKHPFAGTGVALVTPFKDDLTIDFDALRKLVDYVINNGVDYIVALGTTAETPTLDNDDKKEILSSIIRTVNNRVPVVCGIGGNNTFEIINQLRDYDLSKVAGILSVVPYYNKPTQEGIFQHFKTIADATDKPIILYNVPGRTNTNMLPETALRLARECKNVIAIKEASGNISQCMELVQGAPQGFAVLSGDDDLVLPQVAIGMKGVISVAANCYTKPFTSMVNAALNGDYVTAQTLHYSLLKGIQLLFAEGNPTGVKSALAHMGIILNNIRMPLLPASETLSEKIKSFINTLQG